MTQIARNEQNNNLKFTYEEHKNNIRIFEKMVDNLLHGR
jgi:hypothetical protein